MIHVEIKAPHKHLTPKRTDALFYLPWDASQEMIDWCDAEVGIPAYSVNHMVNMTYEQGVGQIAMFDGLRFSFDKVEDAMLFKMTWF